MEGFGWFLLGWWGNTGKAGTSGRLAFATRLVDLMAAGMRITFALCVGGHKWLTILPPTKRGKKLDQMVVRIQGARPCLLNIKNITFSTIPVGVYYARGPSLFFDM